MIEETLGIGTFCWRAERAFWQSLDGTDYIGHAIDSAADYLVIELARREL